MQRTVPLFFSRGFFALIFFKLIFLKKRITLHTSLYNKVLRDTCMPESLLISPPGAAKTPACT